MTTTGSTLFNMDFTEIAEEAWERAGREMRSGYDLRTARRSMNLMTIEWQNKGINMWTMEQGFINLTPGLSTYALPTDTIDLLEQVIRTGQNTASTRLSGEVNPTDSLVSVAVSAAATTITLDTVVGLAGSGFIRLDAEDIYYTYITGNVLGGVFRGQNNTTATTHSVSTAVYVPQLPAVTVWPTPDNSTPYQFVYWRLRRVQDAGAGVETADMNFRFLPCLVAGLAYHIAIKVPELMPRIQMLKQIYDETFEIAAGEDREKASVRFVPRPNYIGSGT